MLASSVELDNVNATNGSCFYVACTRARDRLNVSAIKPGAEFIGDLLK